MVGGRRLTTVEAVQKFVEQTTQATCKRPQEARPETVKHREQAIQRAKREVERELAST
jgi:hypothetical protein